MSLKDNAFVIDLTLNQCSLMAWMHHFYFAAMLPPFVSACKELIVSHVFITCLLLHMTVTSLSLTKSINSLFLNLFSLANKTLELLAMQDSIKQHKIHMHKLTSNAVKDFWDTIMPISLASNTVKDFWCEILLAWLISKARNKWSWSTILKNRGGGKGRVGLMEEMTEDRLNLLRRGLSSPDPQI